MQIQTFSIVVGSAACNARCPFCVSKMTGIENHIKPTNANWTNFRKACKLAHIAGATTVMLTGKGEPTLFPEQITEYLYSLGALDYFPLVELQTNGLTIQEFPNRFKSWRDLGLSTVAISVCHYDNLKNKNIYTPNKNYPDLVTSIKVLHEIGLSVRLVCVLVKNYLDSLQELKTMIQFAMDNKVEQLTFLPLNKPTDTKNEQVTQWVMDNALTNEEVAELQHGLTSAGARPILRLQHGATVYDFHGQNVCWNFCLDQNPDDLTQLRNLIFYSDGRIKHRWDAEGSVIL